MVAKVQKWGNSQGLRINSQVLKDAGISVGDEVDIAVREGFIVVSLIRKIKRKYSLEQLVAQIPGDYKTQEMNWGKPCGNEAW